MLATLIDNCITKKAIRTNRVIEMEEEIIKLTKKKLSKNNLKK